MQEKNYKVIENPKGHDFNIAGIRTASMDANTFNDWIAMFYIFEEVWNFYMIGRHKGYKVYSRKLV